MSEPNQLFVYGTLGPGRPNEHWLKDFGGTFHEATIKGRLYPEGWGATLGYPTLVLDQEGPIIQVIYLFLRSYLLTGQDWMSLREKVINEYPKKSL